MAKAEEKTLIPIEEIATSQGIPRWQLAGVMAANNWAAGKELDSKDFEQALNSFLKGPMTGVEKGGGKNGKTA